MSQKLRLKWDDFQENLNIAFGSLREDNEFADMTLASEDGQQMDAHKVILAASSPEPAEKEQTPSPTDLHERGQTRKPSSCC